MTLLLRRRQRGRLERLELKAENGRPTESQLAATAWCRPLHQEPRSELKDVRHAQQCRLPLVYVAQSDRVQISTLRRSLSDGALLPGRFAVSPCRLLIQLCN